MDIPRNPSSPLYGVRIWLSGAVPREVNEQQRLAILEFVGQFAATVYRAGGHIVHGSHPSFTPILLDEAKKHRKNGGRKDCLTLAVSKLWSKDTNVVPVQDWRETCTVYEIPEATGEPVRDNSLQELRNWMSDNCDAFVAVGGMWWKEVAGRSGVPLEAGLAIERGVPCFLLGGLGGVARDYVRAHPEVIKALKVQSEIFGDMLFDEEEKIIIKRRTRFFRMYLSPSLISAIVFRPFEETVAVTGKKLVRVIATRYNTTIVPYTAL